MTATNGKWIPDIDNLTCWNEDNCIEVVFERRGNTFVGKLNDMPDNLMDAWASDPNGSSYIRQAVTEAEEAFLQAYAKRA